MKSNQDATPKPSDGRYLFINSSAGKTTRDPDESFTIASHVSKNHRKWLKDQRLRRLTAATGKAVAGPQRPILPATVLIPQDKTSTQLSRPQEKLHSASATEESNRLQNREHISPIRLQSQPGSSSDSASTDDSFSSVEHSQRVFRFQSSQEPPPLRVQIGEGYRRAIKQACEPPLAFWKGNADPFSASAVPLNPRDFEVIRQAQRFLVFAAWPDKASAVFRTPIADTSNSHVHLQQTMSDEAEIHAILASGYQVVADSCVKEDPERALARSLAHKTKAVALLRERLLQKGLSESVATVIRLLISLDFQAGEHGAALVHLRGLWSMAASTPGVLLDAQELLIVSDVWISMSLLKKPEIPPTRYDPGERSGRSFDISLRVVETENEVVAPGNIPIGSRAYSALDSKTQTLMASAREIVDTKSVMDRITDPVLQHEVVWWMHRRATAVTGSLLVAYVEANEATTFPKPGHAAEVLTKRLVAATCLSLILYMNLRFVDSPSNYNFTRPFQSIEPLLRRTSKALSMDSASYRMHDEVYLWLLFLCAMGNDVFAARGDISYSPWPALEFNRVAARLGAKTEHDTASILHQFPFFSQMDEFNIELFSVNGTAPSTHIVSWSGWCNILDHYSP